MLLVNEKSIIEDLLLCRDENGITSGFICLHSIYEFEDDWVFYWSLIGWHLLHLIKLYLLLVYSAVILELYDIKCPIECPYEEWEK